MTGTTVAVMARGTQRRRWGALGLGVLVPLLAFAFDPGILRADSWRGEPFVRVLFVRALVVTGFGVTALGIVCALATAPTVRCRSLLIGVLDVGIVAAALLQLALLPIVVVGWFVAFGAFGLAPLLTLRVCRQLRRELMATPGLLARRGRALGVAIAVLAPFAISGAVALRAPVALRSLALAPTAALQREVAIYQRLFELADVANDLQRSLDPAQAAAFAAQREAVGIKPLRED